MSEQKHTPEPWIVGRYGGIYSYRDGFVMSPMIVSGTTKSGTLPRYKENEARIVECVNALAGIENPAEWVRILKEERVESRVSYWKEKAENSDWRYKELQSENERIKAELAKLKQQPIERNPEYGC